MAGIKYSRQREAILAYLHSTKEHPTAEKVYMELRAQFPKLSLGTVYRNLNLLAESGEILRLSCGDSTDLLLRRITILFAGNAIRSWTWRCPLLILSKKGQLRTFRERFRDTRYIFMVSVRTACRHKVYADPLSDKLQIKLKF